MDGEKKITGFNIEDVLRRVFIAFVVLMLMIAVWGLYSSINDLIQIWVDYKYAPLYRTLLNLGVLVITIYVLNLLVRRERLWKKA
ncbi:hypothetical protein Asulf_00837 [Archaeoglobus sulfaticallidus PM70-1]|uniref:DUF8060 domain-containing protein n=1 Tax=Archaeoglobus sulfaticallidus PM70-1 TaxID=387631 RepID=N0BK19_9EURY|nr:hypothetical protein [Archaeoglobus sulfaticallidus]AGK60846.1 hypothetical protein Asulf_00837 [Archaeoglobus sulfaticallidus PM70-1]